MTTTIKVAVNGNYKIPVKQGPNVTWVSGRGNDGPREHVFNPTHGDGATFVIGPEEPDSGEPEPYAPAG
ncbi:hypothetical protein [Phenylobacterium sp.]|uniref:hypothetical protein n=1 Tax=Phenylobacterium sp. TaxID=1871053 RepID=UPI002FCA7745